MRWHEMGKRMTELDMQIACRDARQITSHVQS